MSKLSGVFSHLTLGIVTLLCLNQYSDYIGYTLTAFHGIFRLGKPSYGFFYVTLICLLLYAFLGILERGLPATATYHQLYEDLHDYCSFGVFSTALPCYLTEIWLLHEVWEKQFGYLFIAFGISTTLLFFIQTSYVDQYVVDALVLINNGTLILLGINLPDVNMIIASMIFIIGYLFYRLQDEKVAAFEGFCNYSLALFTYFTCQSVVSK